jgi:hypothetical protein
MSIRKTSLGPKMRTGEMFADATEVAADLAMLETLTAARKDFLDSICAQSSSKDEQILGILRSDSTFLFAQFLYLLRARELFTGDQIAQFADLHNEYIVQLLQNPEKMARLGLASQRLLEAMFTADTMPRLIQNWEERRGAIDQSNLARFLVTLMSTETCRKMLVACDSAGFLERTRTNHGATLVRSTGLLEQLFVCYLRVLRKYIG